VVCVQTANGDWLTPLGVVPPLLVTGWLFYGLAQLVPVAMTMALLWKTKEVILSSSLGPE
jgi:hypothetical protein